MIPRIAVLIPCFNEAAAIRFVIRAFQSSLPYASIYVYDNNSTDDTCVHALAEGAIVRKEYNQGKGHVIRRMFADIDADYYVLADGDGTYDAAAAPQMIRKLADDILDIVIGARVPSAPQLERRGHTFGNRLFSRVLGSLFGRGINDPLSGYRVMSRRFVKTFPALAAGFEIEMCLNIHALQLKIPFAEVATSYNQRLPGTESKLRTYRDGTRILWSMVQLLRLIKPFRFYGSISALLAFVSLAVGTPVVVEFLNTGLVPRLPTAVLASGVAVLSAIAFMTALALTAISHTALELKRIAYQSQSPRREAATGLAIEMDRTKPHEKYTRIAH